MKLLATSSAFGRRLIVEISSARSASSSRRSRSISSNNSFILLRANGDPPVLTEARPLSALPYYDRKVIGRCAPAGAISLQIELLLLDQLERCFARQCFTSSRE